MFSHFVCGLTTALLSCAIAQSSGTGVAGRVLDSRHDPLPGAKIQLSEIDKQEPRNAIADDRGVFHVIAPVGEYSIEVAKDGFTTFRGRVRVSTEAATEVEYVLSVSPVVGTVTVTESAGVVSSATRTATPVLDLPQSITIVTQEQIRDQMMLSLADVVRYVPGISAHQGENNRDQLIIRGQSTSADFYVNGVRDDVQYYRDLYNLERVEALQGPNAMAFGRGGGGGVINRVTKEAGFTPYRQLTVQGGEFDHKRTSLDLGQPLGKRVAARFNGMFEDTGSFRRDVGLRRYGLAPTVTVSAGAQTRLVFAYEYFHDRRVADRGVPSFQGLPARVDFSTYYGNPADSRVGAAAQLGSVLVEHQRGRLNLRNRTQFANTDRDYQNYVPGAASADGTQVALSAYNNATARLNAFHQTDVTYGVATGWLKHTLLGGGELGRQGTDNFRNTGYFNGAATSIVVPFASPQIAIAASFRQSATDANNRVETRTGAVYAQDQIAISRYVQIIAGLRLDRFDLRYTNHRNGDKLRRIDNLVSPRLGVVLKPVGAVSVYGNYSVAYLPSAGDQFSSLTTITQQVKPEKFENYETGVKWDAARGLSLTAALYRLNRTNTRAVDPNDATRILQTGSQRTDGAELGFHGRVTRAWRISGGYAYQDASIRSATAAAKAGAQVAQVPHHMFSFWNQYQATRRLSAGLGLVNRTEMFAAVDNTVRLPGYARVDAALFYQVTEKMRVQCNVENLLDKHYFANADNNTNISPGSPRAVRVGLTARF